MTLAFHLSLLYAGLDLMKTDQFQQETLTNLQLFTTCAHPGSWSRESLFKGQAGNQ